MIILFDVDNCLSDDLWRHGLIDYSKKGRDRYHAYHRACPNDQIRNIDKLRYPEAAVFLLTAMPEEYRRLREGWLAWHGIHYERMLMRGDDHVTNSVELKRAMVRQLIAEGIPLLDECFAAYDDKRPVVQMYRDEGLPGVHLQISEQEHLHRDL